MTSLTPEELEIPRGSIPVVNRWLKRGDGIAVYENLDMSHPDVGHRMFISYGSPMAQLEQPEPPKTLPDIGGHINWRYQLQGVYRGDLLS